jgi:hypothetical protein
MINNPRNCPRSLTQLTTHRNTLVTRRSAMPVVCRSSSKPRQSRSLADGSQLAHAYGSGGRVPIKRLEQEMDSLV